MMMMIRERERETYAVDVFDSGSDVLVLNEEVVTSGHVLHDVAFDLFVLEHGESVVDEDGRRRGFEVGAEVGRRLEHVHRRHLQADRLQLGQQVQVHEVLLAEQARPLAPAIYRRRLPTFHIKFIKLVKWEK